MIRRLGTRQTEARRFGRKALGLVMIMAGVAALAGCSTAPEWARPGFIYGDENAAAAAAAPSGIDKFPELAAVPDRRSPSTTPAQRAEMLRELAADRAQAKRTDQILENGGSKIAPPNAPPIAPPIEDVSPSNATGDGAAFAPVVGAEFAVSTAPPLAPGALEAAGPVVTARYLETHGLHWETHGLHWTPSIPQPAETGPPVTVNLAALDYLPGAPGPALAKAAWGGSDIVTLVEPARAAEAVELAAAGAADPAFDEQGGQNGQGGPGDVPPYVVFFNHGSAAVTEADREMLAQAVDAQRDYEGVLRIIGHASGRTGSSDPGREKLVNFNMSLKRATAVAQELIRRGADPAKVIIEARGDADLTYIETMPEGEAGNRRAEIFLEFGEATDAPLMTGSINRF